ncbi:hypothetical protein YYE_04937 [Plasmodium vinckei vinckei]|uniref:Fam-b protein n=1 Tax=Plasmodium vinckei vinckei TaxID=54757 RepID=A0A081I952_PLAVN|nr:hypothetical protein YYE_04937 [Plasmodium vinckei vinckei]
MKVNILNFKYKESNTRPNLNNLDGKTKKLIHKIQKELNEAKKELDNERNGELSIHLIQDKRVIKKSEHIFKIDEDKINDKYNKITLSNCYKTLKKISKSIKSKKNITIRAMLLIASLCVIISLGMTVQTILLGMFASFIIIIIGNKTLYYEFKKLLKTKLYRTRLNVNNYNILNKLDLSTLINKIISYIGDMDSDLELCLGKPIFGVRVLDYGL